MKMITKDIPQKRIGNLTDLVSVINFLIWLDDEIAGPIVAIIFAFFSIILIRYVILSWFLKK